MRTKTLLIAAAALVAGVVSSEAQVYSANIVGYVNISCQANDYYLLNNPLTTGNDVITNVLQNVPGGSVSLIWNGSGYNLYTYSSKQNAWKDSNGNTNNLISLPPGVGFFYQPAANVTNVFVGSVDSAGTGSFVTNSLGSVLTPVGSIIPFADVVTNSATVNLQVPGASTLQIWDPVGQAFTLLTYSSKKGVWLDGNGNTNNPTLTVGEGFFISSATATNWVQTSP